MTPALCIRFTLLLALVLALSNSLLPTGAAQVHADYTANPATGTVSNTATAARTSAITPQKTRLERTYSQRSHAEHHPHTPAEASLQDPGGNAPANPATHQDPLVSRYDLNGNGIIDRNEVIAAIRDYLGDNPGITRADVIRLIRIYLSGPTTCTQDLGALTRPLTRTGQWDSGCGSSNRPGSHAWFYTFTLAEQAAVLISLQASQDAALYLLEGSGAGGRVLAREELSTGTGGTRTARIILTLDAGTYTIEAAGPAGPFSLSLKAHDRYILETLYNATNGPNWRDNTNWLSSRPIGEWHGVTTGRFSGRVTGLELWAQDLDGPIPPEFAYLTAITHLELSSNNTGDPDLAVISQLPALRSLGLRANRVSDIQPLLNLRNLTFLDVVNNPLSFSSVHTHIPRLKARGVTVQHPGYALRGGDFQVDQAQIYKDNLFIMPIQANRDSPDMGLDHLANRFYQHFNDDFDFLGFVAIDYPVFGTDPFRGAYYARVKNEVQGIGLDTFSDNESLGSEGRLQGFMRFSPIWNLESTILHELLHPWAAHIMPGELSYGAHWLGFNNLGSMFSITNFTTPFEEIVDLGEGRYQAEHAALYTYGPLDRYLAGFIPPEEVPDFWVAADGAWADRGASIFTASEIRRYSIGDVIAAHGKRVPGHSESQREFRAAIILLIDQDQAAVDTRALDYLSSFLDSFSSTGDTSAANNFHAATGGRATITIGGLSESRKDAQ